MLSRKESLGRKRRNGGAGEESINFPLSSIGCQKKMKETTINLITFWKQEAADVLDMVFGEVMDRLIWKVKLNNEQEGFEETSLNGRAILYCRRKIRLDQASRSMKTYYGGGEEGEWPVEEDVSPTDTRREVGRGMECGREMVCEMVRLAVERHLRIRPELSCPFTVLTKTLGERKPGCPSLLLEVYMYHTVLFRLGQKDHSGRFFLTLCLILIYLC